MVSARPSPTRIYLSFADEDRERAMRLVRWLNDSGWRVLADDRHSFPADDHWSRALRLDFCDVVLFLITPGWLLSKPCQDEYAHAVKHGKFVLPVIWDLADLRLLPPGLRPLPYVHLGEGRLSDYLVLKDTLAQAGSRVDTMFAAAQRERWWRRALNAIMSTVRRARRRRT
ncbi:MAG: toll/interleukin-1 receptor domain-containing protein [Xanthobacteraceae bacterium]